MRQRHTPASPQILTVDAQDKVRAACRNERDRFLVELLAGTGMRVGEACGLRLEDLHFLPSSTMLGCDVVGGHVHVRRRIDNENGAMAKSWQERSIPIGARIASAYSTYRLERDRVPVAADSDFVFVNLYRARRLTPATSDADELDQQRARSNVKHWVDKITGMVHTNLELDPVRDSMLWSSVNNALASLKQQDGNAATPWQQLIVNSFIAATQGGVIIDPSDASGPRPQFVDDAEAALRRIEQRVPEIGMLVDYQTIISGMHEHSICETEDGIPLPVSTARRLCCDAEIIPVVLGGAGEVLDVGRGARTVNRAQRRALRAMHRTCAHPDCTVAFSACKIHHVRWWARDRGPTDIDNLLPLCEKHHHLVHEGRWTLTMTPDRVATWTRPDGTIHHIGCTIDRRPASGRTTTPPLQSSRQAADNRPADRPMRT